MTDGKADYQRAETAAALIANLSENNFAERRGTVSAGQGDEPDGLVILLVFSIEKPEEPMP